MIPKVFRDVDVIRSLEQIMDQHTTSYKSDFELDKKMIRKFAQSPLESDRYLIWMCRPLGTHCLRERDMYIENTYDNRTFQFYHEQTKDHILAFAVHLKAHNGADVTGDIYTLDYAKEAEKLPLLTCPVKKVTLYFEDGAEFTVPYEGYRGTVNELSAKHGQLSSLQYEPESEAELDLILRRSRVKRDRQADLGDFEQYVDTLKKGSVRDNLQKAKAEVKHTEHPTGKRNDPAL